MFLLTYLLLALNSFGTPCLGSSYTEPTTWNLHAYQLSLSGDCHPNPGPTYKFPCGICAKPCKSNQHAVACDSCDTWYHVKCTQMPLAVYHGLTQNTSWICFTCGVPNFSTTLFEINNQLCIYKRCICLHSKR